MAGWQVVLVCGCLVEGSVDGLAGSRVGGWLAAC